MRRALPLFALALALPHAHAPMAFAETRELDAHEHGTGELQIALEGEELALDLEAPGFDIVGFEYEATSDEDKAKIAAAIETLSAPASVFLLPEAAGCDVTKAKAHLAGDGSHDHEKDEDHDHEEEHAHGHDDHDKDDDHDHAHEDKHEEEHEHDEDHAHDDAAHKDEDHDHQEDHADADDHDHAETHSAFHAHYRLTCANPSKLTRIELPYFQTFANAEKLEVQIVTDAGAKAADATREAPAVDF